MMAKVFEQALIYVKCILVGSSTSQCFNEPRSLILYYILKCCNLPVFLLSNLFVVTEGQATFV